MIVVFSYETYELFLKNKFYEVQGQKDFFQVTMNFFYLNSFRLFQPFHSTKLKKFSNVFH